MIRERVKELVVKYSPPGMSMESELTAFALGMCGAFFYSWTFLWRYMDARAALYIQNGLGQKMLIETLKIENFDVLLGNALIGFVLVAIGMLMFAVYHYLYFLQGSKSIYLMKRLPKKMELYKRVLAVPMAAAVLCVAAAFLLLVLYFALYMAATPDQCIPSNQWPLW